MLVLSRQPGEQIIIGEDIVVELIELRGDKARIGITAPKNVSVHRKEVYDAIRRENRQAASLAKPSALEAGMAAVPPAAATGYVGRSDGTNKKGV